MEISLDNNFLTLFIYSFGALQGLVLGIVLFRTKVKDQNLNQWLAVLLFLLVYGLTAEICHLLGIGYYDVWYFLFLDYDWFYGPLIYFIALAATVPNFKLTGKDYIHFLPLLIEIGISTFVKSQTFFWDGTEESLTFIGYWSYVIWMHYPLRMIVSGILIVLYTKKANQTIRDGNSVAGFEFFSDRIVWLIKVNNFLTYFSLFFVLFVCMDWLFFDYAFNPKTSVIYIGFSILIYWMGLLGFSNRKTILLKRLSIPRETSIKMEELYHRLDEYMKREKAYLNPELKLIDVADAVNMDKSVTSKCIKTNFQGNYREWVNDYRYRHFLELIENSNSDRLTLLGLAFECGFNSKASFNRVVKAKSGQTPKEIMQNITK